MDQIRPVAFNENSFNERCMQKAFYFLSKVKIF